YQNGVLVGQAGALVEDTNKSVSLDGSNDEITMGDPASGSLDFGIGDFTVEAWVRAFANNDRVIVSKRGVSGAYWQVAVTDDSGQIGRVRANVFDGAVTSTAYGPAIRIDNGAWHHIVVAFDRDTGITVWVDGVGQTTAGAFIGSVSNAASFLVGKSSFDPYLMAVVDEVAVYPSVLSAARVTAHRNAGAGL
ncbi:MAG: LamG domain-containing protein, partial [Gaiellaceae bacterium]